MHTHIYSNTHTHTHYSLTYYTNIYAYTLIYYTNTCTYTILYILYILEQSQEQIDKIQSQYTEQLNKQQLLFEQEKSLLQIQLEIQLKDSIYKETDLKLTLELSTQKTTLENEYNNKIQDIHNIHNNAILELNSKFAILQDNYKHIQSKYKKLEIINKEIEQKIENLKIEYEQNITNISNKYTQENENNINNINIKHQQDIQQLEIIHKQILSEYTNNITNDIHNQYNIQTQQLQEQSTLIITTLEHTIAELTEKKGAAETQLSEISGKYSDLQDTLYDIKQIQINKNKEYSIQIWRLLTKIYMNNNIHNKTINQLTKQFLSDKKNILSESKKEVDKEVENIYKLCKTFEQIETYHKNIYNTYISYKADTTLSINNDIMHIRDELEKLAGAHNILLAKKNEVSIYAYSIV